MLDVVGSPVDLPRFRVALRQRTRRGGSPRRPVRDGDLRGPAPRRVRRRLRRGHDPRRRRGCPAGSRPRGPVPHRRRPGRRGPPTTAERRAEERRYLPRRARRSRIGDRLLPPRDPREQARLRPAGCSTAAVYVGRTVTAAELREPPRPAVARRGRVVRGRRRRRRRSRVARRAGSARAAEWRSSGRSVVDHPLASGGLGRGYLLAGGRASEAFTVYDGRCQPSPASGPERPAIAATALQDWATCPFRYLLGRVLRVRDVPRPEATESIHPLDEGLLVHAILEEFVRQRPPPSPSEAWSPADRDRILDIVDDRCRDAEARASRAGRCCGASLGDGSSGARCGSSGSTPRCAAPTAPCHVWTTSRSGSASRASPASSCPCMVAAR